MPDYDKSKYLNKWVNEMTKVMLKSNPEWDEDEVKELLMKKAQKDLVNPMVELDNNFTHENKTSTVLSVFDWALERKPIIAGNGTFYKNQNEALNPTATMLDGMLIARKAIKKEMFTMKEGSDEYDDADRRQGNKKKNTNSYYGGSGTPVSAFYSQYSGPATTLTAQSVISTTQTTFEAFLSDNFYFLDIDECFTWMQMIVDEDNKVDDFVIRRSVDEVFERIRSLFFEYDESYDAVILNYLKNRTSDELTRIFYKNQLHLFTEVHDEIIDIYERIFRNIENMNTVKSEDDIPKKYREKYPTVKKYNEYANTCMFMNPNVIPDTIKEEMNQLRDIYMKYIYVPYLQIDRIYRLKYFERKAVAIVDTDSNILNCTPWVNFCFDKIMIGDYDRSEENNVFIAVNSLTYILTAVVNDILWDYGKHSNVPKEYRHRFNMKNEFFFTKLIVAKSKKRYLSLITLREGNLYSPKKVDVKGFDFMKSGTAESASAFYKKVVEDRLLFPENINIKEVIKDVKGFEEQIYESLATGSTEYLPIINAKPIEAYKDKPYSKQAVRATYAWNTIYKDDMIELPTKVKVLKLKIFKLEDIEDLKYTHPEIYASIKNEIFNSNNTTIARMGLQVLAIPSNRSIPEWTMPYIDYNTIINNIIAQFNAVLEIFDLSEVPVGKSSGGINRKTNKFSNIVNI